ERRAFLGDSPGDHDRRGLRIPHIPHASRAVAPPGRQETVVPAHGDGKDRPPVTFEDALHARLALLSAQQVRLHRPILESQDQSIVRGQRPGRAVEAILDLKPYGLRRPQIQNPGHIGSVCKGEPTVVRAHRDFGTPDFRLPKHHPPIAQPPDLNRSLGALGPADDDITAVGSDHDLIDGLLATRQDDLWPFLQAFGPDSPDPYGAVVLLTADQPGIVRIGEIGCDGHSRGVAELFDELAFAPRDQAVQPERPLGRLLAASNQEPTAVLTEPGAGQIRQGLMDLAAQIRKLAPARVAGDQPAAIRAQNDRPRSDPLPAVQNRFVGWIGGGEIPAPDGTVRTAREQPAAVAITRPGGAEDDRLYRTVMSPQLHGTVWSAIAAERPQAHRAAVVCRDQPSPAWTDREVGDPIAILVLSVFLHG